MTVVRLTAAQALVKYLQGQYSELDAGTQRVVPAVLGIFGHGNACGLGQALTELGSELPFTRPQNEQAMVHTALGFAKASRRLATLACTSSIGPGATNLVTGAATATTNRLPVLLLPGDTFANRRQGPVLQQLQHAGYADWSVNESLRSVSRYFDRISRPEQILTALPEAMRVLLDPAETGAVTLSLHQDVQGEAYPYPAGFFEPTTWRVTRRPPANGEIAAAADAIRGSLRPLIIAGGGVRYSAAEQALAALSRTCRIPVAETSAGKGMSTGELSLGGIGVNGTSAANHVARAADLVICVGTRLSDFTTASSSLFQASDVRFIGINVNAADARRLGGLPIVADARLSLEALGTALGRWAAPEAHAADVRAAQAAWSDVVREHLDTPGTRLRQTEVLAIVNEHARAGDWVVAAAGAPPGDLLKLWRCPPGSFAHLEFAFSCMGHEIPAGLGIRMADRDAAEILVVIGDGTYLMAPTELVTAVHEQLKVTVVLLINGGYQSIHHLQRASVARGFGTEFAGGIDYLANARSMGCTAFAASTREDVHRALQEARSCPGPVVIACEVEPAPAPESGAWWDLGVPETVGDELVRRTAAAYAEGAARQRFYG